MRDARPPVGESVFHFNPAGADMGAVLAAGRHHGLTAYDAAYLVLAEREGIPLATLDAKLWTAAQAAGVSTLGS
jgi:hypothetical protein